MSQEYSNNHPYAPETGLFQTFADLVLTGKRDRCWHDVAMKTQRILDALLESANAGGIAIVFA